MATHSVREAGEQAVKAGRYFSRVLAEHERTRLAFRIDDTVVVVTRGVDADELERRLRESEWMNVDLPSVEWMAAQEVGEPGAGEKAGSAESPMPVGSAPVSELQRSDPPGSPTSGALTVRFHEPQERGKGSLHLHVKQDVTLGRRVRKTGECLCSKKRGSQERQKREGDTKWCPECVKVATEHGLL